MPICNLGAETLKILIFVRHRETNPTGMEKTSYSMQRGGIDVSIHIFELQLLSVTAYKAYHSAVCLCRTLEPNYRAVWKSSACQQNWQGEKKIHIFAHSQKNKIFRQNIITAADGHLQNKNG